MFKTENQTTTERATRFPYRFQEAEVPDQIEKEKNKHCLAILGLDPEASEKFAGTTAETVESTMIPCPTPPRVVNDPERGRNVITPRPEDVANALASGVEKAVEKGHHVVTIACNTASLEDDFVDLTLNKLRAKGLTHGEDFVLVTPLRAVLQKYHEMDAKPPLFLGTTVISERLPKHQFDTLHNTGHHEVLDLVQEIIWRIKATGGSDVSTAPKYKDGSLYSQDVLDKKLMELENQLTELGIDELTMGCSELPIGFKRLKRLNPESKIKTVDPAKIVAEQSLKYLELNPANKKPKPSPGIS